MFKYTFTKASGLAVQGNEEQLLQMENGFLIVEVLKPDGTRVMDATVGIYTEEGGKLKTIRMLHTGVDGRTEVIPLPAPAKKYSLLSTSINVPYSVFTIRVEYEGYYTNIYKDAQVFAGTTTTQSAALTPLPLGVKNASGQEILYTVPKSPLAE